VRRSDVINCFVSEAGRGTRPTYLIRTTSVNIGHETIYDVTLVNPECTFITFRKCSEVQ
jgi:hypothetical protein